MRRRLASLAMLVERVQVVLRWGRWRLSSCGAHDRSWEDATKGEMGSSEGSQMVLVLDERGSLRVLLCYENGSNDDGGFVPPSYLL